MPSASEVIIGVSTGLIQTFLFNPIDRALYLHVKDNTSFLAKSNWLSPYHGVFNALGNRVIQYGFYYNIVDWNLKTVTELFPQCGITCSRIIAGVATGVTTSVLLNPVSCVKYHAWGTDLELRVVARNMRKEAGLGSFTRGLGTTAVRDSVFTVLYLVGKKYADDWSPSNGVHFLTNSAISCMATIITAPINYIRNMKYSKGYQNNNPSVSHIYRDLVNQQCPYKTYKDVVPIIRYYTHRLAIGWGTLRVGVGIASGQYIFDYLTPRVGSAIEDYC